MAELLEICLTLSTFMFLWWSKYASFSNPQSITQLTPLIVSDVSATFVAKMIFLVLFGPRIGSNTLRCSSGVCLPYNENTLAPQHFLALRIFAHSRLAASTSSWAVKNTKMSPLAKLL